jgi:hypothetical protein
MSSLRSAGFLLAAVLAVGIALPMGESFALAVIGIFLGFAVGATLSDMADLIGRGYRKLTKDDNAVRLVLVSVIGVVAVFLFLHLISERSQRSFGELFKILTENPHYAYTIGLTAVPTCLATLWWRARRRVTATAQPRAKEPSKKRDRKKRRRRPS